MQQDITVCLTYIRY